MLQSGKLFSWGSNALKYDSDLGIGEVLGPETCADGWGPCSLTPLEVSSLSEVGTLGGAQAAALGAVPPAVTYLGVSSGEEGTAVPIIGSALANASAVDFGSVPAKLFTPLSPTEVLAFAPAGTGTVDVSVTTPQRHQPSGRRRSVHLHAAAARARTATCVVGSRRATHGADRAGRARAAAAEGVDASARKHLGGTRQSHHKRCKRHGKHKCAKKTKRKRHKGSVVVMADALPETRTQRRRAVRARSWGDGTSDADERHGARATHAADAEHPSGDRVGCSGRRGQHQPGRLATARGTRVP